MANVVVVLPPGITRFLSAAGTVYTPDANRLITIPVADVPDAVEAGAIAPIGYTSNGAAVTQITSRATGVAINALSGTITTDTSSLAAEAAAVFTVTNPLVAIGDVIVLSQQSGSNGGNTAVGVTTVAAGSFAIKVSNNNAAGGTAETGAIIINFALVKSVAA